MKSSKNNFQTSPKSLETFQLKGELKFGEGEIFRLGESFMPLCFYTFNPHKYTYKFVYFGFRQWASL